MTTILQAGNGNEPPVKPLAPAKKKKPVKKPSKKGK